MSNIDVQNTLSLLAAFASEPLIWLILLGGTFILGSFIHWAYWEIQWQIAKREYYQDEERF